VAEPHTVEVYCKCSDIEHCDLERYISDVRILLAEFEAVKGIRMAEYSGSDPT
jgi:hypothetical protein